MAFLYPVPLKTDTEPYPGFTYERGGLHVEILHIGKSMDRATIHFRLLPDNNMFRMTVSSNDISFVRFTDSAFPEIYPITTKELGFCMNDDECAEDGDFRLFSLIISHNVPNQTINVECKIGDFISPEYEVVGIDNDILMLRQYVDVGDGDMEETDTIIAVSDELDRNLDLMDRLGIVWIGL